MGETQDSKTSVSGKTHTEKGRKLLGEILISKGIITPEKLATAQEIQKQWGVRLGNILTTYNFANETDIAEALSEQIGWEFLRPENIFGSMINHDVVKDLDIKFCLQNMILPITLKESSESSNGEMAFAIVDPYDTGTTDTISHKYGLAKYYITTKTVVENCLLGLSSMSRSDFDLSIQRMEDGITAGQAKEFLYNLVRKAVELGATDIHLEPAAKSSSEIRLRIDGILRHLSSISRDRHSSVANVLLTMAKGNPGEPVNSFEGQIEYQVEKKSISLRVSSLPTVHGASIVLRIHDKDKAIMPLELLGYEAHNLNIISDIISLPHGLFLVVGPTGCGKTTSFYSIITKKKGIDLKIVTIEDPVEIRLSLTQQVQLNLKSGMDYSKVIRLFLRQDPDVMLVGEIRDKETAIAAAEAALTGHLVLATLHTNSAIESILRLRDLGLSSIVLSEVLLGVVSQRLVRKLCKCNLPRGCEKCAYTGYLTRTVISEVLRCTPRIADMIREEYSVGKIYEQALVEGFKPIKEDAKRLVDEKVTDVKEIKKVLGVSIDI